MKTFTKVYAWSSIVLGTLAIISSLGSRVDDAFYTFLGGIFFFAGGVLPLITIDKMQNKINKLRKK